MKMMLHQFLDFVDSQVGVTAAGNLPFRLAPRAKRRNLAPTIRKIAACLFLMALSCSVAAAATWYVDGTATGSSNGTSWANAWTSLSKITGVSAGDVVYISGGASGSSQTYSSVNWSPAGGTQGNPITYQVGQDSAHDGMVILNGQNSGPLGVVTVASYTVLSGQVGAGITGNSGPTYSSQIKSACHMEIINPPVSNRSLYDSGRASAQTYDIHICYIYWPGTTGGVQWGAGSSGAGHFSEFDHCYMVKSPSGSGNPDDCMFGGGGNGFDQLKVHDNYFQVTLTSNLPAIGDDFMKWGSGVSWYNNHYQGVLGNYGSGNQHSDVFQVNGDYEKCYNNYVENPGESFFYQDDFSTPVHHHDIYIFNNVVWVGPTFAQSDVTRGIDILPESNGVGTTFTDLYIANNTFYNIDSYGIRMNTYGSGSTNYALTRVNVVNNLFVKMGTPFYLFQSGIGILSNKSIGTGAGGLNPANSTGPSNSSNVTFVNLASGDLHPAPSDTGAIGVGTNWPNVTPSFKFNTDKDGNLRPATAWSIGAYEGQGPPAPQDLRAGSITGS
jgi:hypothetical protein